MQEIGEAPIKDAPGFYSPQILMDVRFEFVSNENGKDIKLFFNAPINGDTKVIISATKALSRGQRRC